MVNEEPKPFAIRAVAIEELPLLLYWRERVIREVFEVADSVDLQQLMEENRRYYERAIPTGNHLACVAYAEDGAVMGSGSLCFSEELPSPDNPSGLNALIMNVFTAQHLRGHGIGTAIIAWLVNAAHARGVQNIYLESTKTAFSFYRGLGFKPLEDYFIYDGNSDFERDETLL